MKITVYDGLNTIGGNKIHIEENGHGLFLDFGKNFARYKEYYKDFMKERAVRGIYDLWHLGLIPKLNIYREDLIPGDLNVSTYPKIPVDAVLISHAHLDHAGNAFLLKKNIPIVCSSYTIAILKAMMDTAQGSGFNVDLPYYAVRYDNKSKTYNCKYESKRDREGCILLSDEDEPYSSRDIILFRKNYKLIEFLKHRDQEESDNGKPIKMDDSKVKILDEVCLGFEITQYAVDHSICGATAYIVEGDVTIAYTGDFRRPNCKEMKNFIRDANGVDVLIIEGTRVSKKGDEATDNITETDVYKNACGIVEDAKGLVVVYLPPRNFERFDIFKKVAKMTDRELVVTPKMAYFLEALRYVDDDDRLKDVRIYRPFKGKEYMWEQITVFQNGNRDNEISRCHIKDEPEKYIMCLTLYEMAYLLDIMPENGTYIYSFSEAYNEEEELNFQVLWNWCRRFNFEVHGFSIDENGTVKYSKGLHASGHASKEDLIKVIEEIDPEHIIPVHTENPGWFAEMFGDKVVEMKEGKSWEIGA